MGYLPSKNFIAIVGSVIIVLFTGYFASFVWKTGHQEKIVIKNTVANNIDVADASKEAGLDSDNDGLKNWEEVLWKTDINKADTDGDGVSDNEEIADGRDPAVKRTLSANGTWSDAFKKPEEIIAGDPNKPGTLTEKLTNDFITSYFTTKQAVGGQPLNASTKTSLTNALAHTVEQGTASYRDLYTKKDIKISGNADPKTYLNRVGAMFDKNFKDIDGMEVQIVAMSAQTGKFEDLAKLEPYLDAYKKTVAFLVSEPVPPNYADLHLMILNSMNTTGLAVESLKLIKEDPVRSIIGVQLYYREIARARQFLDGLKTQTEKDKITFGESDTGSFFNDYFKRL